MKLDFEPLLPEIQRFFKETVSKILFSFGRLILTHVDLILSSGKELERQIELLQKRMVEILHQLQGIASLLKELERGFELYLQVLLLKTNYQCREEVSDRRNLDSYLEYGIHDKQANRSGWNKHYLALRRQGKP